jgi:hypothetical protein
MDESICFHIVSQCAIMYPCDFCDLVGLQYINKYFLAASRRVMWDFVRCGFVNAYTMWPVREYVTAEQIKNTITLNRGHVIRHKFLPISFYTGCKYLYVRALREDYNIPLNHPEDMDVEFDCMIIFGGQKITLRVIDDMVHIMQSNGPIRWIRRYLPELYEFFFCHTVAPYYANPKARVIVVGTQNNQ